MGVRRRRYYLFDEDIFVFIVVCFLIFIFEYFFWLYKNFFVFRGVVADFRRSWRIVKVRALCRWNEFGKL